MKEKIQGFFREKRWQQMKKSDWLVLALVGVLLLLLAVPSSGKEDGGSLFSEDGAQQEQEASTAQAVSEETLNDSGTEDYVTGLELRLEEILSQMDGVGEVKVMITVSDCGETVVEKDLHTTSTSTTETDSSGSSRTTTQGENISETLFVEENGDSYPYVKKEKLPTIAGVVVVAEGAGNSTVVSNISKTVEALFSVEAHKIMVVKMHSREDAR